MAKKRYGKLVRDNIPHIIRTEGSVPHVRTLDTDEYRRELCYKLIEEAEEVRKASDAFKSEIPVEIADVLEVVDALLVEYGISAGEIERIRTERRSTRGGFTQRMFLDSVDEVGVSDVV